MRGVKVGAVLLALTAYWFAKGVGMVKQSFDLGTGEIILELKEFNPAKP